MSIIYTPENCQPAYQLTWALSLFWKVCPPPPRQWFAPLQLATELDGVRVLEHRFFNSNLSLFLISSQPHVAPAAMIRSAKGRLQYLVREEFPSAFRRNYSLVSVGKQQCDVVEKYVATQLDRYPFADDRVMEQFRQYQVRDLSVDLNRMRRTTHGEYVYGLHLVVELNAERHEFRHEVLLKMRAEIERLSYERGWLLSRAGILPDHVHLTLGCQIVDSPAFVALGCLNSLAAVHGMLPVFRFGYYVGGFGPYDLGAIWNWQRT